MLGACDGNIQPLHILDEADLGTAGTNSTEQDKVTFLALKRIDSRNTNVGQSALDNFNLCSVPV
jgi:hypothetical protein